MLDTSTTIARTVLDHSECAAVFQRHRIDYCCNGARTIAAAAQARGLDEATLIAELQQAIATRGGGGATGAEAATMTTPSLIAHIISTHHEYLRKTLPFVGGLAAKVGRVHGAHDPRLVELDGLVAELTSTLIPHLDMEEQRLFPALMAGARTAAIAAELDAMLGEHVAVGALLGRMRAATDDYQAPDWACTSYRTLLTELERLEDDTLRHVHLENHALAPRFQDAATSPQ